MEPMEETMAEKGGKVSARQNRKGTRDLTKKLTAVGWGLFFIWLGIAMLFNADVGFILMGVGLITLGMQAARKYYGLDAETFWIVVAVLFIVVGLWQALELRISIMAALLIVVGCALLISAIKGKQAGGDS